MAARGRPSLYTDEVADLICERLASGESLLGICRDPALPSEVTVRRWAVDDVSGFSAKYARARDMQADAVADLAVAEAIAANDAQLGRLAYDARRWQASKLAPKRYSERLELDATVRASVVSAEPLSEDEWNREYASGGVASPGRPATRTD